MNSSTKHENITEAEFTLKCRNESGTGGFYAEYKYTAANETEDGSYFVTACMSGDKSSSPWKNTRDRQEIVEELYLRLDSPYVQLRSRPIFFRLTITTTVGYFELPSYSNGGRQGPILDKDPIAKGSKQERRLVKRANATDGDSFVGNPTLLDVENKGPLFALALAIFGKDSFIDTVTNTPNYNRITSSGGLIKPPPTPMGLMGSSFRTFTFTGVGDGRVRDVTDWIEDIKASFFINMPVAAYLANKEWLNPWSGSVQDRFRCIGVSYDRGIDVVKPKISNAVIIVSSLLLGLHILGLIFLGLYTMRAMPFADQMGAEVMVKLGAHYADRLDVANEKEWETVINSLPGYIGDANPESDVGKMEFGATAPLETMRKYQIL